LLRSETKRSEIQVYFSLFLLFSLFSLFSTLFRIIFVSLRFFSLTFRLFYLLFRFRFLVFRIEVNHVKSGFFFASKRNEIFTSISNFASEAKVRAHPNPHQSFYCVCSRIAAFLYLYNQTHLSLMYRGRRGELCTNVLNK
jgi:hypothetical protein